MKLSGPPDDVALKIAFTEMALEAFSVAAFLISSDNRILIANTEGDLFLNRSEGLLLLRGELFATDPVEHSRLAALVQACCAGLRNDHQEPPGGAVSVSRSGRGPLQVTVLPVSPDQALILRTPCALMFVLDPDGAPRSRATALRSLYSLTPTETRLANLLLQGHDVKEIALEMHISDGTARFHIKRILNKTGTNRQSELIRLMLRLPGQDL